MNKCDMSVLESILTENYFKTEEDLVQNLDKWKKGGSDNVLFITGLSGSGKTTKAKELAEKHGAAIFSLDEYDHHRDTMDKKFNFDIIKLIRKKFLEIDDIFNKHEKKINAKILANETVDDNDCFMTDREGKILYHPDVISYIVDSMHKRTDVLFIIEGFQLYAYCPKYMIEHLELPVIIKQTSMFKSMYQRFLRESNIKAQGKIKINFKLSVEFISLLGWYLRDEKRKNLVIKKIKK